MKRFLFIINASPYGEERFLSAALHTWDFIDAHLVDHQQGEWFRGVNREGAMLADTLKVSFWKCPYHNGRMGIEAVRRLGEVAAKLPVL